MHRPMLPKPAMSMTFSCQLRITLIAAPVDSLVEPGRDPTWLKPVCWGVRVLGVRLPAARGAPLAPAEAAMPLYL